MHFRIKQLLQFFCLAALSLVALGLFNGCASNTSSKEDEDKPRVSSVPWNRPQGWEGKGQLGGMMGAR